MVNPVISSFKTNPRLVDEFAQDFDMLRISVASPDDIFRWSKGEVLKPETINYRTLKPEKDGLFCAKIFGPAKDYECSCGKYKRMKHKGVVCEKCGVEVTKSSVRRERMGHIDLASPVAHIWFLKSLPSRISLLIDAPLRKVEQVIFYELNIVIEPGITDLARSQLLTDTELNEAKEIHGYESFTAGKGAEAIREILVNMDLEQERKMVELLIENENSEIKQKKLFKRLSIIKGFIISNTRPEWMILTRLPVMPVGIRPLVPLDGSRFASSDLNDLYRRVINRNNRLRKLIDLQSPDIIINNEKRMLQDVVDALFDNSKRGRPIQSKDKRPLKSLSDMLKGKQGRFRQNLLGKRVDFSGRSVVVVGPELRLHQCGLPKKMAIELFKPFICAKLAEKGLSSSLRHSKKMIEQEKDDVWEILEEIMHQHPVLLNRAPTLHRLGIQAFEPLLIEGKAIRLHPLVCTAFNADFDGDQMAVHVPLSPEAQLEARCLMMSTNNILHPANGSPVIVPSQDIVLGLYYLTLKEDSEQESSIYLSSLSEAELGLANKKFTLHTRVKARIKELDENNDEIVRIYETTPGRMIFGSILPKSNKLNFSVCNKLLTKKEISNLIELVYRNALQKDSVIFCDKMKDLGFKHAALSGISFGKDDMEIPASKEKIISETFDEIKKLEDQCEKLQITREEKYNRAIDLWSKCSDRVANDMDALISNHFNSTGEAKPLNSIYMMSHSGARGSKAQMKQLAGMRGLMAKPSGEIIETPIISNFKEGLNVLEYFTSTHGARKGLADTALKTANSGYLTRRLVDSAQDCIITEVDCGTHEGVTMKAFVKAGQMVESLYNRVVGRVISEDMVNPKNGEVLLEAGKLLDEQYEQIINDANILEIKVRSPIKCELEFGICTKCYGRDLARGFLVNIGESVGVIAAQSIGEPGTQLTMRTFHIGGAATISAEVSTVEASVSGILKIKNVKVVKNSKGENVNLSTAMTMIILDDLGRERETFRIPYGATVYFEDGMSVEKGEKLAIWDPFNRLVISEFEAYIKFESLIDGVSVNRQKSEITGLDQLIVLDWRASTRGTKLRPAICLIDENDEPIVDERGNAVRYYIEPDSIISVEDKSKVTSGQVIARIPTESRRTSDITGGLPRIDELFEARLPKDAGIMCAIRGIVKYGKDYKTKRKIEIIGEEGQSKEYFVPKNSGQMHYQDGDSIEVGDYLLEGKPVLNDFLEIKGLNYLISYLIDEIQDVYRLQGVSINSKHIEIIARQMLQKYKIVNSGDTELIKDELYEISEINYENDIVKSKNLKPAKFKNVIIGITKSSLLTRSFISAASFQETTRVLTEAAINGKSDYLLGLKENVILGRLIPAGTGSMINHYKKIAKQRDSLILETKAEKKIESHSEKLAIGGI